MDKQDHIQWLISKIGLEAPVKRFNVEYVVTGGGYSGTVMNASNITELIEMAIEENSHSGEIAIMAIDPVEKGVKKRFHLLNYPRI